MEISMFINNSSKCFALLWAVLLFSGAAMAESSWSWQHPYPTGSRINGIQFINNSDGWIVTELGALFCTDDGGVIWEELYRGDKKLESVFFLNTSEGWACGEDGILIHTVDGGATGLSHTHLPRIFYQLNSVTRTTEQLAGTVVLSCEP